MSYPLSPAILALAACAQIALAAPALAETHKHDETHAHDHAHAHGNSEIYKGYFADDQVMPRPLLDWAGDWQSVYPLLKDGTLDPVMQHKAENGDKTAADYHAYYDTGYATDTDRIEIVGDLVTFYRDGSSVQGTYRDDGYEILVYKKGNRGVRYVFEKSSGDEAAPQFIQFSDHGISSAKADHFHLYWGDDRAALLDEVENWPTYYPADLTGDEVLSEMLAH